MLAKVTSCAAIGLDSAIVEVEVDTSRGLPSLTTIDLPGAAVQESGERVRAAIENSVILESFLAYVSMRMRRST
jgi:magnesium chelatase family protein